MLFNSADFMLFFPLVVSVYFFIPRKLRYIWLLVSSYYFYMNCNPKYALLMGILTIITFLSGLLIEKGRESGKMYGRICVAGGIISSLLVLGIFKYADFVLVNLNNVFSVLGKRTIEKTLDLLLPVGISFYTFQAIGYVVDVYRGEIQAEKNILKYGLFVSFFPQLVAGPIERSRNLLNQIREVENIYVWDYKRIHNGVLLMFWGFFQKLVIADRISIVVKHVYGGYQLYGFGEIMLATVLFAFQIYCDFGGYSNIARGAAQVMGFRLMKNFKQPYLAGSIKEFWRRWHISLTTWFTDYIYIPLGGNRKGKIRKYWNIFIVFTISGLWHGASWNFIAWGMLHAFYQIGENFINDMISRHGLLSDKGKKISLSTKIRKIAATFVFVNFAWIFFIAGSFKIAIKIINQMFSAWWITGIGKIGLNREDWIILAVGICIIYIVDVLHEKQISVFQVVEAQEIWFRWALYLGLFWGIILFGIYGIGYDTSQFIYFQF